MYYKDLFNLKNKVAVVTGAAGLLGKEFVKALSENGASVIAADIAKDKGNKLEKFCEQQKAKVDFKHLDIAKAKSISELINFADRNYKKIDIWVNSAYPKTKDWGVKFESIPTASWRKNIDAHLNGYCFCCRAAAEYMKKKKSGGSIVNLASIYGILGPDFSIYKNTDMTMPAAYSVIKGGIINFTRYLASYYGKYDIRVNSISPGGILDKQPKAFIRKYQEKTPLRRMANKEDVSGGVVYLASDNAKYITGHNLVIDGGWSII
ncbi:MAG: oxidoreductase [Candidatus Omnitrophota bacterium]|jgi:NAD(P)-dependent dehydrogenase (short-subunit alcohol dehydrogenase family)